MGGGAGCISKGIEGAMEGAQMAAGPKPVGGVTTVEGDGGLEEASVEAQQGDIQAEAQYTYRSMAMAEGRRRGREDGGEDGWRAHAGGHIHVPAGRVRPMERGQRAECEADESWRARARGEERGQGGDWAGVGAGQSSAERG